MGEDQNRILSHAKWSNFRGEDHMPKSMGEKLDDTNPQCMGTYDYTPPNKGRYRHFIDDMNPHNKDPNYVPGLSTTY